MKNVIVLFLVGICFLITSAGQTFEKEPKNAVHLEALGHGVLYSVNYERLLFTGKRFQTAAQIGIGYYGRNTSLVPLIAPITINERFRLKENHFIEAGIGVLFFDDAYLESGGDNRGKYTIDDIIFRLGYRYQSPNDKWVFRAAYTPTLFIWRVENGPTIIEDFMSWPGVSVGYRF